MTDKLSRAQGCLLGQLAGDSLGSLVEFQTSAKILKAYPNGVRELADGGPHHLLAGQPTDDSEMALLLARVLATKPIYELDAAIDAYVYWFRSNPFDCGATIASGLSGDPDPDSQANGAMMRISPLGIFGVNFELSEVGQWAMQDALITHPHPICQQANMLFVVAITHAIQTGIDAKALYEWIMSLAVVMKVEDALLQTIERAAVEMPDDYIQRQGWVLIAFQNALYQLRHAANLEEGIVDTVMQGGDTDTNAAICGALLGAVYGIDAVPEQWLSTIKNCRPQKDDPRVRNPRPEVMWPADVLSLAKKLI